MKVIKRSGEEVEFDLGKIVTAITKAADATENDWIPDEEIQDMAQKIQERCENTPHTVSVEEINDNVEDMLMYAKHYAIAKNFITYRYTRTLARKKNTTDDAILSLLEQANEEAKQENSNKNPVINSTQRDYMAGEVSKDLTMRVLLPQEIADAHKEGIIHFHDSAAYRADEV